MKVVIDASCLVINPFSGLSEVVHNLLLHLPHVDGGEDLSLFINYFRKGKTGRDLEYPGTTNRFCRVPRRIMDGWWRLGRPAIDFLLADADVYHSLHVQVPPTRKMKTVLTVHDCRYAALPELYHPRAVEKYRRQMKVSLDRADMVNTVSEFTRRELLHYFSFPENRTRVIYNGFDGGQTAADGAAETKAFVEQKRLPGDYLFFVGSLDPRKNLKRLIEAVAICRQETRDFPDLVIAGVSAEDWAAGAVSKAARQPGVFDHVHLCGTVDRKILTGLTRGACALCYPSLYEGFGFPPLEAMSLDVPVLAGNRSSIPEISGPAACLVDPASVDDIARGLTRIVFDSEYRRNLVETGRRHVRKYSWRKAAAEYMNLYHEVVA